MRLFWLSLAALSSAMAAPPQPQAESGATNIVFPGRANEDDSQRRRAPSAVIVDTKDVREQGREKCELKGSRRGCVNSISHSKANAGLKSGRQVAKNFAAC